MSEAVATKSIFVSKTFWVNALTFLVLVLTALLDTDLVKQHPDVTLYIGMVLTSVNIWLRRQTERPVSVTQPGDVRILTKRS